MDDLSLFSDLVEHIYDASLDAALWPEALQGACAFVQGCMIAVYYKSLDTSTSLFQSWGQDPHFFELYRDTYSKLDPFFPASLFLEVGKVHSADDLIPFDEFRQTLFYKEWARPQGLLDALQCNLERSAAGAAFFVINRRERDGAFDAAAKARFALIVPHVRRAIAIGKTVAFHRANEAALADTLDGLAAAVLLVAQDGRLVHVNKPAAELLTSAHMLRASQGRLVAVDPRVNTELQDAIARAARGDAKLGVKGAAISLATDDRASQVAHVLSLASGRRRGLIDGQAAAAVFVRKMTFATPAPLEIMARVYGLTTAEVRVLASLTASSGVADMARILGIGESTVKTHLHRRFAKTGAKRQADLIRLLACHGTPLGS